MAVSKFLGVSAKDVLNKVGAAVRASDVDGGHFIFARAIFVDALALRLQAPAAVSKSKPLLNTAAQVFSYVFDKLPSLSVYMSTQSYRTESVAIDRRYEFSDEEDKYVVVEMRRSLRVTLLANFASRTFSCWVMPSAGPYLTGWRDLDHFDFLRLDDVLSLIAGFDDSLDAIDAACDEHVNAAARRAKVTAVVRQTSKSVVESVARAAGLKVSFSVKPQNGHLLAAFDMPNRLELSMRIDNVEPAELQAHVNAVVRLAADMAELPKGFTFRRSTSSRG